MVPIFRRAGSPSTIESTRGTASMAVRKGSRLSSGDACEGVGAVPLPRRGDRGFDVLDPCRRLRDDVTVRPQGVDVQRDRVADVAFRLLDGVSDRNAAGQVRHVGREVLSGLLDHHGVLHRIGHFSPAFFRMLCSVPVAISFPYCTGTTSCPCRVMKIRFLSALLVACTMPLSLTGGGRRGGARSAFEGGASSGAPLAADHADCSHLTC